METINYFLIDTGGQVLEDKHTYKSGVEIFIETGYNPTFHNKKYGILKYAHIRFKDIKVGSKIYLHYLAADNENLVRINNETLLKIHDTQAFCSVLNDKINMLHGFILVKPVIETNEELKDKMKNSGIEIISAVEKSKTSGTIAFSSDKDVVGLTCYFNKREAFLNEVEGEGYYLMEQKDAHILDSNILQTIKN